LPAKIRRKRLERADWIRIARNTLITSGIDQVKVDRLAKKINITRGSFYWFFKSRMELLDALLNDWETTNTRPLLDAIQAASNPRDKLVGLITTWVDEKAFSPRYDSAVRDWARTSSKVSRAVQTVDERRIDAITGIFREFGYQGEEALIRARVAYFHQVGYYTLHVKESHTERMRLFPLYYLSLSGYKM